MPFAKASMPSIALTQLRSVIEEKFGDRVKVNLHYFNVEMAAYLGEDVYDFICNDGVTNNSGFGDWYFRDVAFPDLDDNKEVYFKRYAPMFGVQNMQLYYQRLDEKRSELKEFLISLIEDNNLLDSDIVGFTSMFMQNAPSFALARLIKERNSEIPVVMGGANCEYPMGAEIIKNVNHIDFVFSGPALESFPEFVQNYLYEDSTGCHRIDGVFSKENIHKVKRKSKLDQQLEIVDIIGSERDINDVINLDYDSFLQKFESHFPDSTNKLELLMETSRGCWWGAKAHCTFCGLNGATMAYRAMEKDNALHTFNTLFDKYSHKVSYFSSVDNIVPREYLTDVFPELDVPEGVSMFYEVKADLSDEDMKTLADAHVLTIQPGIEALSTSTLKLMRKGTTAFNNIKFLENALKYGIKPAWNLLIGFPGETEDVFEKYLNDLPKFFHLPPPVGVATVRFDRFSPYFTQADEYGLELKPLDYYKMIFPFSKESLDEFAYYFMDMNYDADYIQAYSKYINELTILVNEWKEKWQVNINDVPSLYLYERNGANFIYDSRFDFELEYEINDIDLLVLDNLKVRKSFKGLVSSLKQYEDSDLFASVNKLLDNDLLFEEKGTYMSLILLFKSKKSKSEFEKIFY